MLAQHAAIGMNEFAGFGGIWAQLIHQRIIAPGGHEADILTVRLFRHRQAKPCGGSAHRGFVWHVTQGEARHGKLRACGGGQEVALVPFGVHRAMQFRAIGAFNAPRIMTGRQGFAAQILGHRHHVAEFHGLIAANAGHRRFAARIAIGKITHHIAAENLFTVQNIMRDAELIRHAPRIQNILPRTASAFFLQGRAMIIKLQGGANHLMPGFLQQRGNHAAIHPARHGHQHAHPQARPAASSPCCQKRCSSRAASAKSAAKRAKRASPP